MGDASVRAFQSGMSKLTKQLDGIQARRHSAPAISSVLSGDVPTLPFPTDVLPPLAPSPPSR